MQEIVREARDGSARAFGELVTSAEVTLLGFMKSKTGNREDAEELIQETFLQAFLSIKHLEDSSRFLPWLYAIGRNKLRDYYRKRSRITERALADQEIPAVEPEDLDRWECHETLCRKAADSLQEKKREVVQLRYFSGLSYDQISALCGISVELVKSRLFEARKDLKRLLPILHHRFDFPPEELNRMKENIMKTVETISKGAYVLERLSLKNQMDFCRAVKEYIKFPVPLLEAIGYIREGKEFVQDCEAELHLDDFIKILNYVDRKTEIRIVEELDNSDPEFSLTIKRNMFVFEDLILFDKSALKKLHDRVDSRLLKRALFGVEKKVRSNILSVLLSDEQRRWEEEIAGMDISQETVNRTQYDVIAEVNAMEQEGLIRASRVEVDGKPEARIE